jgi:hypothetical protein
MDGGRDIYKKIQRQRNIKPKILKAPQHLKRRKEESINRRPEK